MRYYKEAASQTISNYLQSIIPCQTSFSMLRGLSLADSITAVIVIVVVLLSLITGFLNLLEHTKRQKAKFFYSFLVFSFGLTLFYRLLVILNIFDNYPGLLFIPLYFTLAFGPLLFLYVKLRLFPDYKFVLSDGKHLILPVGQFLFFLYFFLQPIGIKEMMGRDFYSPFYGSVEMLLYIFSFYFYILAAFRFVKFKENHISTLLQRREIIYLKILLKILLLLFWFNSAYIILDFVSYNFFKINLHNLRGFKRIGDISFAAMAFWIIMIKILEWKNKKS